MRSPRKIILVKYGSFSHVNEQVATFLSREFPGHPLVVVDAAKDILASFPLRSLLLRFAANLRAPRDFFGGRHSPWDFVFRDIAAWDMISEWISRNVNPAQTDFVFQTQSMFDASRKGIPFFVYTDHTRRAHKRQGGGRFSAPLVSGWEQREQSLYRSADTVFTLSDFCRGSVIEDYGIPAAKALAVSTGINMALPDLRGATEANKPVILFVGGEWKIKGGPLLVDAFRSVRRTVPEAELWLVGARPTRVEAGMRVFGRVDRRELDALYRQASVLCVPSIVDRASMVALDAAAYELPVVTNPFGAGSERVVDGVTGRVVDPHDTQLLASVLRELLCNPELRRRFGRAGRERIEKEFTWESVGAKVATRIREVLHAKNS